MNEIDSPDFAIYNKEPFLALHCEIVEEYAEFSEQDIFDVFDKIVNFKELVLVEFMQAMKNSSDDKWNAQLDFYVNNTSYIYDLLTVNSTRCGVANKLNKFIPNIMHKMKEHKGSKTFLDFGAGCGVLCQMMVEWGKKKVTYIDIEAQTTDFARWRFKKHNLIDKVEMLVIPQVDFTLDCQYSIIFTDAVWEHLPQDQQELYARKLALAVEPNGMLVFIVDVDGTEKERSEFHQSLHYIVDMNKMFDIFKSNGLDRKFISSYKGFASVWEKINE